MTFLTNLFTLFISGGPVGMIIITLLFIALFFAAWKAPAWVKEIGIAALVVGVLERSQSRPHSRPLRSDRLLRLPDSPPLQQTAHLICTGGL